MNGMVTALLVIGLLAGCDAASDDPRTPVVSPSPMAASSTPTGKEPVPLPVPIWDATRCGDDEYKNARMERHPELMGRAAADLLAAYGKPRADTRFRAGEGAGTYSGGVASQLPGGAERNARTPVREIIWQRADCNFIVRFRTVAGAWRVFDAFEASSDADF